jgi:exodeoxyribonuclease VII small subunit
MTNIDEISIDQLTYEQAFNQLDAIVAALEGDELTLEAAMSLFERGQKLIQRCNGLRYEPVRARSKVDPAL